MSLTRTTPSRGRLWRFLRISFSLAVAIVLALVCLQAVHQLSHVHLHLSWPWIALAWPISLMAFPLLALAWAQLLQAYGYRVGAWPTIRMWSLAQASRYLPTGLFSVVSRAALATQQGVPRSLAVTTMAVEGILILAWSCAAAAAIVLAGKFPEILAVAFLGLMAVLSLPWGLPQIGRLTARHIRPDSVRLLRILRNSPVPVGKSLSAADAIVGCSLAAKAAVFLLLARSLVTVHLSDIALLIGAGNLAVVAGMIGVTPAGVGVREGVLIALLAGRFGVGPATLLALMTRIWDLTVEIPWIVGCLIADRRHRGSLMRTPDSTNTDTPRITPGREN